MAEDASPLLLLNAQDNVLVARHAIPAGTRLLLDSGEVILATDIALGHKVARTHIAAEAPVLKYAAPIGRATTAIAPGEHVHVHNIRSDYTPTYHLEDIRSEA